MKKEALFIGLAGMAGAVSRAFIAQFSTGHVFATWTVNVIGAFLLCLFVSGIVRRFAIPKLQQTAIKTGFLGSFTTFSTFSHETVAFFQAGNWGIAILYSLGTLLSGVLAGYAGFVIGRRM